MCVSMGDSVNDTEGSGALQRGANKKKRFILFKFRKTKQNIPGADQMWLTAPNFL